MFAHRFFAARTFAPRYFPPVGAVTPAPAPGGGNVPRYASTRTVDLFAKPIYNRNTARLQREDEEIIIL
jgi:hypothetical protein